ncbi:MAG: hypothetical protein BZ136_06945 [Methanosphaera sp. rholeuAM74]|nr:MAG: hypothetical protein BZ136_06945 [Methanosphaera sp. rholeuAM74]
MIKIAHFADTHLGYRQYGLNERENDFYKAFEKIIDDILEKDIEYVIHSGDLFENPKPPIKALLVAQKGFEKLTQHGVEVYVIAGNHDIMQSTRTAIPQKLYENDRFHILSSDNLYEVIGNEVFIGGLQHLNSSFQDIMSDTFREILEEAKNYPYKILMLHGSLPKYFELGENEFELETIPEGFDYYAMGHLHARIIDNFKNGVLSYPGSTEIRRIDELSSYRKDGKGYNLVTFDDSNDKVSVEYVNIELERKILIEDIEYPELDERLDNILEKIMVYEQKPILNLTIKGGMFEIKEVHEKINDKLSDYTLTLRMKYEPNEDTTETPELEENLSPEYLIKEELENKYGKEYAQISKLGVDLYSHLSKNNIEEAKHISQHYYNQEYTDKSLEES